MHVCVYVCMNAYDSVCVCVCGFFRLKIIFGGSIF